jgi:hypothetical protein
MKAEGTNALLGLRVVLLTLVLFGLYAIDFVDLSITEEARAAPAMLLLVSFLHTLVLSYPILRSRWTGWRLVGAIFLAFYGVTTLMVAIEAVYLPETLPPDLVVRLIVNGAITTIVFSVLAVLVHTRTERGEEFENAGYRVTMPWTQWVWRLAVIGLSWAVLFVLFGALVFLPLAGRLAPDALADYANLEMPAWVLPFQAVRGMLWAVLALPVIRMMNGSRGEVGLAVALLFAVLMGANLLRPAGLPVGLQVAHFVEVFGENFVFGWIVVWLLRKREKDNGEEKP